MLGFKAIDVELVERDDRGATGVRLSKANRSRCVRTVLRDGRSMGAC